MTYINGCLCTVCKSVGFFSLPISHSLQGCPVKIYCLKEYALHRLIGTLPKCIWRLYPYIFQNPLYCSCPLKSKRSSSNKWNALLDLIAKLWRFIGVSGFEIPFHSQFWVKTKSDMSFENNLTSVSSKINFFLNLPDLPQQARTRSGQIN